MALEIFQDFQFLSEAELSLVYDLNRSYMHGVIIVQLLYMALNPGSGSSPHEREPGFRGYCLHSCVVTITCVNLIACGILCPWHLSGFIDGGTIN